MLDTSTALEPLWRIEEELTALLDTLDVCDEDLKPELEQRIAQYLMAEVAKVDSIDGVFRLLEHTQTSAKAEIDRLQKRKKAAERTAERLEGYLLNILRARGGVPLKGRNVTFSVRHSEALVVIDSNEVPAEYKRTTITVDILKTPIKEALKSGIDVPGVMLEEREHLSRR